VCQISLKKNGLNIRHIKNPSQALRRIAIKNNPHAIFEINQELLSKEDIILAISKDSSIVSSPVISSKLNDEIFKTLFKNIYLVNANLVF